jgi:hypothetical protein
LTNCLNCGHSFKGKYCPACGQKAEIERYTAKVVLEEMLHFFTHFEKGFLHTAWSFVVKPGITSINFLKGKRKQYQSPVSYLFICTGLYLIVHNYIITHFHYHVSAEVISSMNMKEQANVLLRTHFTPFILIVLIVSAFIIYRVLAKPKFNFVEVFIISVYGGGTYMMMLLLSDIVLGFIFKINVITQPVFLWQTTLSSLYNFWFCYNFFSKLKLHLFWLRLITTALLVAAAGFILFIYLPLARIYLFVK